jgi:selenocysteine-specific elongation factor
MTLVLGTAGHVDHGKTALVLALTGHDTDRLPEEKARGISIALGFAPLALPSGTTLSLVDVPGHERFVRHMVAGASGIDGYLLCVAADDGVMPQTQEHLSVLGILGVDDGVVAVTKSDLMDPAIAVADIRELIGEGPEIVPVSAPHGAGLAQLRGALQRLADRLDRRTVAGPPRLFVDRVFSVPGAGTVVTGTHWGGSIAVDERVVVIPGGAEARVRGIESHDTPVALAESGRVALNLAGVDRADAPRGACVVRAADGWVGSERLDVALTWLPDAGSPLATRRRLQAFLGTAEVGATVVLLDADTIAPGETRYAQLRLDDPVAATAGDRIVLRSAERRTVGGARVIDPHPDRHGRGSDAAGRLALIESGDVDAAIRARVVAAGPAGLRLASPDSAERAIADTAVVGGWRVAVEYLDVARAAVDANLPTSWPQLAGRTGLAGPLAEAFLTELVSRGEVVRDGSQARRPDAVAEDPVAGAVLGLLVAAGRRPPTLTDLAEETGLDPDRLQAILVGLRDCGALIGADGAWFAVDAVASARDEAVAALAAGPMGIGALRDLWGVGRRHALALAAALDQAGVTRRVGDERVLRRGAR